MKDFTDLITKLYETDADFVAKAVKDYTHIRVMDIMQHQNLMSTGVHVFIEEFVKNGLVPFSRERKACGALVRPVFCMRSPTHEERVYNFGRYHDMVAEVPESGASGKGFTAGGEQYVYTGGPMLAFIEYPVKVFGLDDMPPLEEMMAEVDRIPTEWKDHTKFSYDIFFARDGEYERPLFCEFRDTCQ